jgi:hypothetical protein
VLKKEKGELEKKALLVAILLMIIILSLNVSLTGAQPVYNADTNGNRDNLSYWGVYPSPTDAGKDHMWRFTVTLKALGNVTFNQAEMNLLKIPLWKDWTFKNSTQQLPGRFDVVRYDVGLAKSTGGPLIQNNWDDHITKFFQVDYNNTGTPPTAPVLPQGYNLTWIQIVYNNYPALGGPPATPANEPVPSPHIDPYYDDNGVQNYEDGLPFYFSNTEMTRNNYTGDNWWVPIYNPIKGGKVNMTFYDAPSYAFSRAIDYGLAKVSFEAHLYAAAWNRTNPGTVIVYYNGVKWGYEYSITDKGVATRGIPKTYTREGVAGDEKLIEEREGNYLYENVTPVGGNAAPITVPVDNMASLATYIALASTIIAATVASAIYVNRVKSRKKKQ